MEGLTGKVLITGGSGSLGTAIVKRARDEKWDCKITVMARNESKMNLIRSQFPEVTCIIGDVRDLNWLTTVFPGHETIIHAAAIKIVPVAEASPREAVQTNVIGSLNVAQAAIEAKVKKVIGISSDKACGPTQYGLTKRLMEGIFREATTWGDTEFVCCRYGNVLKSANSIVPLFERQIAEDKPFTITHLAMTRFWLSMKQAIDLVLFAASSALYSGEIIVPKAPAMKLVNLAKALDPNREVVEIGIRAGERLQETLIVREEAMHTLEYPNSYAVYPPTKNYQHSHLPFQFEYTSENPHHWLSVEELKELLKDS